MAPQGAERTAQNSGQIEDLDRKARRLVGFSLFLLAVFVAVDAVWTLWHREKPEPSFVGIALTAVSIGVMWWLARAKRRAARVLGERVHGSPHVEYRLDRRERAKWSGRSSSDLGPRA
jgi:hypothetical protein